MQSIYSTIDAMKKQFSQQTCPITFLAIKRRYRDKSKEIFEVSNIRSSICWRKSKVNDNINLNCIQLFRMHINKNKRLTNVKYETNE